MIVYLTSHHCTCHPERRAKPVVEGSVLFAGCGFFDSAALCAASLRMTYLGVLTNINDQLRKKVGFGKNILSNG